MLPVVVFDTNVLLSAIGWKGSPYHCIDLARQGRVKGLICPEILDELTEKLEQKLKFTPIQVIETIADLLSFLRLITIANTLNFLTTDPNDNMVLECAIVGNATHIVTGDKRHLLPLGSYQGIAIVSARDFLTLVIPE
ncbi:putative toxin-antitoxin system toxin component, PIN family [Nostoc favosum]|uniref:Toxin-antitoxin system toxin component, PIN family n=1 Tax=Nostoc favosum CHAB5714 TaxID=2780399 RepID=A0ABS8I7P0_9NOSO|nr:putative toxin-antitoxin system toxin component, PIN family [Nostoc favosum]MCC5599881.1 putative toxin-antitoxin system toxin component, PIN family [Nostoc favosum CHAB5714]MCC5620454.1 putative toxin-antitoxin system toxin component, PIN family [Nostoc sp. CHAB 5715]